MKAVRCITGGLAQSILMILLSYPIHVMIFGHWWDTVSLVRPVDSWQVIPGMALATICWGILLSLGFAVLYKGIPGKGLKKGFYYGLLLWLIFIWFVEFWNYLQLDIPFMVVIAGLLFYLITLPLGGVAIAAIYGQSLDNE